MKSVDSSKLENDEILFYYMTLSFGGCSISESDKVIYFIISFLKLFRKKKKYIWITNIINF